MVYAPSHSDLICYTLGVNDATGVESMNALNVTALLADARTRLQAVYGGEWGQALNIDFIARICCA